MLIPLDTVRCRGSVEPGVSGGETNGKRPPVGVSPPFPRRPGIDTALARPARLAAHEGLERKARAGVDPLYLFSQGLLWHQERDASAGWELIQCLRSENQDARAVAAALLAKTENARLLVRDLRRARTRTPKPAARDVAIPMGKRPARRLK